MNIVKLFIRTTIVLWLSLGAGLANAITVGFYTDRLAWETAVT